MKTFPIRRNGAKYWSEADDERLREIASRGSRSDAVRETGRTTLAVKRRAIRLGIRFAYRGLGGRRIGTRARNWTRQEEAALALMIGEMSHEQIARRLGRSRQAINSRSSALGLDSRQGRLTLHEAATLLGVSHSTIIAYRTRLGRRWCAGNGAQPGMEPEDVMLVAQAILDTPHTQVTVSAKRLRAVAEGALLERSARPREKATTR